MKHTDLKAVLRFLGIVLMAEGGLMGLCLVPAFHFADGSAAPIALCALFTLAVGLLLWYRYNRFTIIEDRRMAYLLVVLLWLSLSLFATLPFLATGAATILTHSHFNAFKNDKKHHYSALDNTFFFADSSLDIVRQESGSNRVQHYSGA